MNRDFYILMIFTVSCVILCDQNILEIHKMHLKFIRYLKNMLCFKKLCFILNFTWILSAFYEFPKYFDHIRSRKKM